MKKEILKYLTITCSVVLGFTQFVACGSQLYKVSVEEDYDQNLVTKGNPEANNPESTLYGIHTVPGWQKLPINYKYGAGLNEEQRIQLSAAMKVWETAVGKKLFNVIGLHKGKTGDDFKDLFSSLEDNVNGHYLDNNWQKTNKPDYVLATTIWTHNSHSHSISKADVRFNNNSYIIGNSLTGKSSDTKEIVDMQSLALHELGHLLGLAHIDEAIDEHSIMNPSLFIGEGLTTRQLSKGDIERIQTIYGCTDDSCDTTKVLSLIDQLSEQKLNDPLSMTH